MLVRKDSWHYQLIRNKKIVTKIKKGNKSAIIYMTEVAGIITLPVAFLLLLSTIIMALLGVSRNLCLITFMLSFFFGDFPWLVVLFGLFKKREWKELKII